MVIRDCFDTIAWQTMNKGNLPTWGLRSYFWIDKVESQPTKKTIPIGKEGRPLCLIDTWYLKQNQASSSWCLNLSITDFAFLTSSLFDSKKAPISWCHFLFTPQISSNYSIVDILDINQIYANIAKQGACLWTLPLSGTAPPCDSRCRQ